MIWLLGYAATILASNWLIETFGVVPVGFGLLAPAGVFAAGLAFTLRDLVHDQLGRGWTLAAILAGALLSALVSPAVALASADGTMLRFGPDKHWPRVCRWLDRLTVQRPLPETGW